MGLIPHIKNEHWSPLRQAVRKLATLKLGPTAKPTFAGLTLSDLTVSRLVASNANKNLISSDLFTWVDQTANQVLVTDDGDGTITLSAPQDIHTAATPTFAGVIIADGGNVGQVAGPKITFDDSNNRLEITDCFVGIGTTTPLTSLVVSKNGTTGFEVDVFGLANGVYLTAYDRGVNQWNELYFRGSKFSWSIATTKKLWLDENGQFGVGIDPKTLFTVEGAVTLKEKASADADTAAYGQIWVKSNTPNELWFTNDAGTDIRLGAQSLGTGDTPSFAGVLPTGYADLGAEDDEWTYLYLRRDLVFTSFDCDILFYDGGNLKANIGVDFTSERLQLYSNVGEVEIFDNNLSLWPAKNINDGVNSVTVANLKTAYDHSQDNTQAHSDYLINNGNDSTSGEITAIGFVIGANTLNTNEWANLDGIDQTVATTSSPQFDGLGIGVAQGALDILTVSKNLDFSISRGIYGGPVVVRNAAVNALCRGLDFTTSFTPNAPEAASTLNNGTGAYASVKLITENGEDQAITIESARGFDSCIICQLVGAGGGSATITNAYNFYANNAQEINGGIITNAYAFYDAGQTVATNNWGLAINTANNYINGSLRIGSAAAPTSKLMLDLATEDLEIVDSGSVGATEQDWIEVEVGGNTGYIRVFAAK